MRNYFIYQYEDLVSSNKKLKVTVLFIHQTKIDSQNELAQELNQFFHENSITDKLVVIVPKYLDKLSLEFFKTSRDVTFQRVPGNSAEYFKKNLMIFEFDSVGTFILIDGRRTVNEKKFISNLLRSGSTIIFKTNGGLVESTPDHHFVFPSNKHCSKFIRTGNVLINQAEIFFIAVQLLIHVSDRKVIYCDTSSINTLPYLALELKRRFKQDFECPIVHSFESYEVFEKSRNSFHPNSLVLISSSTSGNIIERLVSDNRAKVDQIQVIFFLGPEIKFKVHSQNIICNLTRNSKFNLGIDEFETFGANDECKLCKVQHSRPILINSDVFLTIQPKIERHLLKVNPEYYSRNVGLFVERFKTLYPDKSVIKVYYKDDNKPDNNYEIYFDIVYLLENIHFFKKFNEALNKNIDKYIPANTKYLLHLPDIGSQKLAEYILSKIPLSIKPEVIKLSHNFTDSLKEEEAGTVVIVASCITTGKKLLQISRLMRKLNRLNLVYFVGIYRPLNSEFSDELTGDLKKGKDKSDERPFVPVETIYCSIKQTETSWEMEKLFLEELFGSIDEENENELYDYVNERIDILRRNKESKGFCDTLFLKTIRNSDLKLRPNFAFWSFKYDDTTISQSEVYFTISTLLSNLEQNQITSPPSLKQTNYVRNMLSPRNFHRFNDGIIQASLLRSGKTEYFAYDLDRELSLQMKEFLFSIIDNYNSEDGEALMEFLLSIGIKRLKLGKDDLKEVLEKAIDCDNKIISKFSEYIRYKNFP